MRGQILLHFLIREDNYPSEQSTIDRLFPWLIAKQPYFLVVTQSWEGNNPYLFPILANPEEPAGGVIKLDMPLGYTGYMCIRASLASALSAEQKLEAHLRQQPYTQSHFACSPIHTGYDELSVCYHEAVTQMVGRKDELSLADTLSLLNFLNLGEYAKCQQVLSSYHTASDMVVIRHVLSLLRRWMYENNLSQTVAWTAKDGDQLSWVYIGALLQNLCEQISNTGQAHSSAIITAVNTFMNEYYALPDISLKYLSEQFNVSIGSLSRMYKQETGSNFSTALFEIRMKKAKEMLTQTSQSIASISLACGYENYLSFKRAFIRIEGISPREYRESHLPTDIQN